MQKIKQKIMQDGEREYQDPIDDMKKEVEQIGSPLEKRMELFARLKSYCSLVTVTKKTIRKQV